MFCEQAKKICYNEYEARKKSYKKKTPKLTYYKCEFCEKYHLTKKINNLLYKERVKTNTIDTSKSSRYMCHSCGKFFKLLIDVEQKCSYCDDIDISLSST